MDYCASPYSLTLSLPGGPTLDLMSDQQGLRVKTLDLGYPDMREDLNLAPARHGVIDYTRLFGARPVTITGQLVPSPGGSRQMALHLLAPFLDPSKRPVMTYQVDPDALPHTLTLRPHQMAHTFDNPNVSAAFSVGFKAPDPLAYDANVQTVVCWPLATQYGRAYNLTFNRTYPYGGAASANTSSNGDFDVYPLVRIYGPVTAPIVNATGWPPGAAASVPMGLSFQNNYVVAAGAYLDIDCKAHTVLLNGDPTQSMYAQLKPNLGTPWPYIPAGGMTSWAMGGSNTGSQSEMDIIWQDAYLI